MFRTSHTILGLFVASAMFASPVMAAPTAQKKAYSGWSWSAHVGNLNIDSTVAKFQGIDDSAWVIGAAAERYASDSILTYALGIDFIGYGDNYSFSQNTNKGEKSSDASAIMAYAEFGPKVSFGKDKLNHFTAHVGAANIFGSERGIDYCANCYSEDIDVDAGLYGVLGLGHSFSSFDLSLQFQQFFSGDLDSSLRLQISSSF